MKLTGMMTMYKKDHFCKVQDYVSQQGGAFLSYGVLFIRKKSDIFALQTGHFNITV